MGIHELWILMLDGIYDVIGNIEYMGVSWHTMIGVFIVVCVFFKLIVGKVLNSSFNVSFHSKEEQKVIQGYRETSTKFGNRITREREYFY